MQVRMGKKGIVADEAPRPEGVYRAVGSRWLSSGFVRRLDGMIEVHHPYNGEDRDKQIDQGNQRKDGDCQPADVDGFPVVFAENPGLGFSQMVSSGTLEKLSSQQVGIQQNGDRKADSQEIAGQYEYIPSDGLGREFDVMPKLGPETECDVAMALRVFQAFHPLDDRFLKQAGDENGQGGKHEPAGYPADQGDYPVEQCIQPSFFQGHEPVGDPGDRPDGADQYEASQQRAKKHRCEQVRLFDGGPGFSQGIHERAFCL